MQDIKKLLGKRIRELRKLRNLTQEELAETLGIGVANISYIETGRFAPSVETLTKLSEAFNLPVYEFYMFEHLKPLDDIRKELIDALRRDDKLTENMYRLYLVMGR